MKPRKPGETDAAYILRLEQQNASVIADNKRVSNWAQKISEAIEVLAVEGSLVFQAMAEKADVRGHPSVSKAVEMFDSLAHPHWSDGAKHFPISEWPTDWDFDRQGEQSGDADMELNAHIANAISYLSHKQFGAKEAERAHIDELIEGLHSITQAAVDGVKNSVGFKTMAVMKPSGHFRDMDRSALLELVNSMSWMALDLAQDMSCTNEMLRRDLRASAYRRIHAELYRLSSLPMSEAPAAFDIKVLCDEEPF